MVRFGVSIILLLIFMLFVSSAAIASNSCQKLFIGPLDLQKSQKNWNKIDFEEFYAFQNAHFDIYSKSLVLNNEGSNTLINGKYSFKAVDEDVGLAISNYMVSFWKQGLTHTSEVEVHGYFTMYSEIKFGKSPIRKRYPVFIVTNFLVK